MPDIRFTLISEGSSDQALIPILKWALVRAGVQTRIVGTWVDWGRFRRPPESLEAKVEMALKQFPCEILFIHRDADNVSPSVRQAEIQRALRMIGEPLPPAVCVVPVRMMEAWFLISERAIREASGNPNGRQPLSLPRIKDIESIPDPKNALHTLLSEASGLTGRRLKNFRATQALHRMGEIMDDFAPLLQLPGFQMLCEDLRQVVAS